MNVKSDVVSHGRCDNKVSFYSRQQAPPIQQNGDEACRSAWHWTLGALSSLEYLLPSFRGPPSFLSSAFVAREMVSATWLPLQRFTEEATWLPCSLQTLDSHGTHSAPSAGIKGMPGLHLLIFNKLVNFSKLVSEFPFSYSLSSQTKLSDWTWQPKTNISSVYQCSRKKTLQASLLEV